MYYEEKFEDGKWWYRYNPKDDFREMDMKMLATKYNLLKVEYQTVMNRLIKIEQLLGE